MTLPFVYKSRDNDRLVGDTALTGGKLMLN